MSLGPGSARRLLAWSSAITVLAVAVVAGSAGGTPPNRPDLVVKSLSRPPSAAAAGSTFRVAGVVGNQGGSSARASVQRFYLSRDRRVGRGDVVIGSARIRKLRPQGRARRRVRLSVPAAVQPGVHRLAACVDTSRKVREWRERNNCRFARKRTRVTPSGPGSGGFPGGAGDRDHDGSPESRDCGPDDPAIRPGATDKPDLDFVDRNCDGIDGDKARAIFVALAANGGKDTNSGDLGQPKATLPNAIAAAKAAIPVKDIYVAVGSYPSLPAPVSLADRVGIYGGYNPGFRSRSPTGGSSIAAPGTGATAQGVDVVVQLVSFSGSSTGTGSVYGLRAANSTLKLERVTLAAGTAGHGSGGAPTPGRAADGDDGAQGEPGREDGGVDVFCDRNPQSQGGAGGNASDAIQVRRGGNGGWSGVSLNDHHPGGYPGGAGGGGAPGGPGTPSGKGDWNTPDGHWGSPGSPGAQGADGAAGSPAYAATGYAPANGKSGLPGRPGGGGGGGGGGGHGTSGCDSHGAGGGGGGGGGLGGAEGEGGASGGGAFGLYLWSTKVSSQGSQFQAARGGTGGPGRRGQLGGLGGEGGRRSNTHGAGNLYGGSGGQDDGSNGGKGGDGGDGGKGGSGGGGAGGPSVGVLVAGGSSLNSSASEFAIAAGGQGGPTVGGNPGPNGATGNVLQPQ